MVEIDALSELTEDEAELYDRQIRLWGLDSQKRLVLTLCKYLVNGQKVIVIFLPSSIESG
jgi:hypothetical protein